MPPLLRLYPFKYRDPISKIWTKARYKATLADIAARYTEWMIDGEPEVRGSIPSAGFNPYRAPRAALRGGSNVDMQPQRRSPPDVDATEADLIACFLRRYVTYCARRGRYAAMQGAAALLVEVSNPRP